MKRYVIELLGTFFVVLAVSLTENPLAIGFMYLAMLYVGARVSGAHYNPAITQAMWLRGKFPTHCIAPYFVAQLLGAIAAIGLEYHISGSLFVPDISPEDNSWLICLLEMLFTFVLCYVYLVTRTVHAFKNTQLYGLILGSTLVGLVSMGGLFNPAIGAAALLLNSILGGTAIHLGHNLLVYVVCPLVGSALAGLAFDYLEAPASGQFASIDSAE
jgi:glycerol uptake facilitator-like aquaporin